MSGILNIRDPNTGKFTPVTAIAGVGVPAKGTTGQILTKISDADYDTQWKENDASKLGGKTPEEYATAEEVSQLKSDKLDKTATAADSSKLGGKSLAEIMLALYPVGAVYISANSTSPASLFGGTWESIGGRFLLGADATYAAGSTGGEATHTLTNDEMPAHQHIIYMYNEASTGVFWGPNNVTPQGKKNSNVTDTSGGNQPHNNMPPYLVVYMWKRVS